MRRLLRVGLVVGTLCGALWGADASEGHHGAWAWSAIALGASNALDGASSWGAPETNPVLGRGTFGPKQVAVKSAIVGGVLVGEWLFKRHHKGAERTFTYMNWAGAGVTTGVAVRNWRENVSH